jgi:hypothetical protein
MVHPPAHPARGTATAALWVSLLGLLCFPILPSIAAILIANSARRAGYPGARARVGAFLGWAGLAVGCLGLLAELLSPGLID